MEVHYFSETRSALYDSERTSLYINIVTFGWRDVKTEDFESVFKRLKEI
jgi:hypothetical protein